MKNQKWIEKNKSLFDEIKPGFIYGVLETEKPILIEKAKTKGKKIIIKIAICEECGTKKAGKKIKKVLAQNACMDADHKK